MGPMKSFNSHVVQGPRLRGPIMLHTDVAPRSYLFSYEAKPARISLPPLLIGVASVFQRPFTNVHPLRYEPSYGLYTE